MAMTQAQALMLLPLAEQGDTRAIASLMRAIVNGEFGAVAGVTASADELNKLDGAGAVVASGTPETFQADLATDANGTAIAGAVNGLRDALVEFGIMEADD